MNIFEELNKQYTIPVLRHTNGTTLYEIAQALIKGGFRVLEITLMSEDAFEVIKKLSADENLIIGAGTIFNDNHTKLAIEAGAQFLVSPGLDVASVEVAKLRNVPFIPGVLTPSEVMTAQALGLGMVKIFPVSSMGGVSYIKNLQGPFPKMKYMATGGINLSDITSYLKAGTDCVGLGSNLTPTEMVTKKDWPGITKLAQEYLSAVAAARSTR